MSKTSIHIFLLCLVLLFSCSHSDQEKCSKLKRGLFYYKSKVSFEGSTIRRYDSGQTVKNTLTGKEQVQKVKWIDPCTYTLSPLSDSGLLSSDSFPIKVSILDVKEKYYTVHITSESYKADFNDTVWIKGLLGGFRSIGDVFRQH